VVAGSFGVPSASLGVVAELVDVGELGLESGYELGCGDEVGGRSRGCSRRGRLGR